MIIDFHTHTFPSRISKLVIEKLSNVSGTLPHTDGSAEGLADSTISSGFDYSVNLPVITNPAKSFKINQDMVSQYEELKLRHIISFGGIHPDCEDYKEQLSFLKNNGIAGIKIHPAYQGVNLDDIRYLRIIEYASSLDLIVLTHAGIDIGIYDHNYSDVDSILTVMKEVSPHKLVLAHMGNWGCWDKVRKYLLGCNAYFDTAFSLGPIEHSLADAPTPYYDTVIDDNLFTYICKGHGIDKILFGSDSPWQSQSDYLARIKGLDFTDEEFAMIAGGNAEKLLKL